MELGGSIAVTVKLEITLTPTLSQTEREFLPHLSLRERSVRHPPDRVRGSHSRKLSGYQKPGSNALSRTLYSCNKRDMCWLQRLDRHRFLQLAKVLGVSVAELLGEVDVPKETSVPRGRMRQVFYAAAKLPRRQQEKIVDVVEAFVDKKTAS